jgi:hypothetical protein
MTTDAERLAAALDRVATSDPKARAEAPIIGLAPARASAPPSVRKALEALDAGDVDPDAPWPSSAPADTFTG